MLQHEDDQAETLRSSGDLRASPERAVRPQLDQVMTPGYVPVDLGVL